MRSVLIAEKNERRIIFNKNEKRIIKNLAEVSGFQQHINNEDTYHFLLLLKNEVVSSYCTLTEKGLAYAVSEGIVSFSAFLAKYRGMKDHYTHIVFGAKDDKEIDEKAREFFKSKISQL